MFFFVFCFFFPLAKLRVGRCEAAGNGFEHFEGVVVGFRQGGGGEEAGFARYRFQTTLSDRYPLHRSVFSGKKNRFMSNAFFANVIC